MIEEICSSTEVSTTNDSWLLDSGASRHMTRKKDWYSSFKPLQEPMNVTVGNNAKCPVEGTGTIAFSIQEGETKELSDVLLVPQLKKNLISVAAITDRNLEVCFKRTGAEILNAAGKVVGRAVRKNNLYELTALTVSSGVGISKVWHERFGHLSYPILLEMQKTGMVAHLPAQFRV